MISVRSIDDFHQVFFLSTMKCLQRALRFSGGMLFTLSQKFIGNKQKRSSLMKKTISTLLISSILLSSTAFASPQSVSEIMSNYKEQVITLGAQAAAINSAKAILENQISEAEMRDYLASELSPRDYKKIEENLKNGIKMSEVPNLVMNTSQGANFKGMACGDAKGAIMIIGGITAGVSAFVSLILLAASSGDRSYADEQRGAVSTYNSHSDERAILDLQLQITALKNEGVSPTSYLITDLNAQIARIELGIQQNIATYDARNAEYIAEATKYDASAKSSEKAAVVFAITAGVSLTTMGLTAIACE